MEFLIYMRDIDPDDRVMLVNKMSSRWFDAYGGSHGRTTRSTAVYVDENGVMNTQVRGQNEYNETAKRIISEGKVISARDLNI